MPTMDYFELGASTWSYTIAISDSTERYWIREHKKAEQTAREKWLAVKAAFAAWTLKGPKFIEPNLVSTFSKVTNRLFLRNPKTPSWRKGRWKSLT